MALLTVFTEEGDREKFKAQTGQTETCKLGTNTEPGASLPGPSSVIPPGQEGGKA